MTGYNDYNIEDKGAVAKRRAVLLAPFVFFAAGVFLLAMFFADTYVFGSPYWNTFFVREPLAIEGDDSVRASTVKLIRPVEAEKADEDEEVAPPILPPSEEAVSYNYLDILPLLEENAYLPRAAVSGFALGAYWADIYVHDDAELDGVPVYQGDNSYLLSQGIGHLYGSSFPGESGVCVLAGHVSGKAGFFSNISDSELYKVGTQIKLDTAYGVYVYEVVDTDILHYLDEKYVRKYSRENGKLINNYDNLCRTYDADELLVMYTCYPAGTAFRTQRYYVICRRIYGYSWR